MFTVYAIKSKEKNYIYVGLTSNLKKRIARHQNGYETTTKFYRPFDIIYLDFFPSRVEAREEEKYLKSGCGKEFLKQIISSGGGTVDTQG